MMSQFARKTALSLSLLGSLTAVAIAPAAEAQVRVTGGSIDGNAAFFVPSSSGNISLFDIAIQNMQIVSPNGVLTNPAFVPTATGGFQDTDSSNSVTAGDTGLITGKLSGIAFSANGSLIPFSQVDTALSYNVGRFNSTNTLAGTLISATSIPQLFLPIAGVTSSDSSVTALDGEMEIGALNANLTAGYIDLPSDVVFRSASQAAVIPFTVPRKIKYEFEGNNVTADSVDSSGTQLSFAGEANKKFKIETFGDGRRDSFELSAPRGYVDITLGNVNYTSPGTLNTSSPLDYEIKGQTEGILALFGPGQVGVAGTGRNTTFKFQQGSTEVRGNTSGNGTVEFLASAGVNRAGNFTLNGGTFSSTQLSAYQQAVSSSSFISTRNTTNVSVDRNAVRFGNLILVFNGSAFTLNGSTTFTTSNSTSLSTAETLIRSFLEELDDLGSSRGAISIFSGGSTEQFELVAAPSFDLKVRSNRNGRVRVKFVQRGGDRIFVAMRGNVGVGAFEQVGPGSRMFPGLFGTRQLSAEDAEAVYALIDTLEVSDTEEADDTNAVDETDDTNAVDETDETSEADNTEVGPAFTGLESLTDEEVDAINSEIESLSTPVEEPAADEAAPAEEPAAEDAAAVEEPAAEEPVAEEPVAEEPVAEEPAPDAGAALVDDTAPVAE